MVLDIKLCTPCAARDRSLRQLAVVKTDSSYTGPENVYAVYSRIISQYKQNTGDTNGTNKLAIQPFCGEASLPQCRRRAA